MNISITKELERFVNTKVKSGLYQSASEVIREAIRLLAERDELNQRRLDSFNNEIQVGLNQLAQHESVSDEELMRYIKIRRKKRSH